MIDDLSAAPLAGTSDWRMVSDRVRGGVSTARLQAQAAAGHPALRLRGTVSLDNNGGFVQMARDLAPGGAAVDLSGWSGLRLRVFDNGQTYNLHLRTSDTTKAFQLYVETQSAAARQGSHALCVVRGFHKKSKRYRSWQSYCASFTAPPAWTDIRIPFRDLVSHRVDARFDQTRVRRIGIVAIGRAFEADIALTRVALIR